MHFSHFSNFTYFMCTSSIPSMPEPSSQHSFARHAGMGEAHRIVLYVEDNRANMALVERLMARRGDVEFLSAFNARTGIAMARDRLPHVILMDVNLPDMNGMDALQVLRGDAVTAAIPVIALSSDAFPRQIEKGIEAGFFQYLTKPFRVEDLNAAIESALAESDARHTV
jgi:CheY-like chemotaxis protein